MCKFDFMICIHTQCGQSHILYITECVTKCLYLPLFSGRHDTLCFCGHSRSILKSPPLVCMVCVCVCVCVSVDVCMDAVVFLEIGFAVSRFSERTQTELLFNTVQ